MINFRLLLSDRLVAHISLVLENMADKPICEDFEVTVASKVVNVEAGGSISWTRRRSKIRNCCQVNETVRVSLQTLNAFDVAKRLAGIAEKNDSKHLRRTRQITGLIHVLNELTALADPRYGKSKGVLPFQEAYELFYSAFEPELPVPDRHNFRDVLLSEEFGLPVAVFTWNNVRYIVLNPEKWNIVRLLDVFCEDRSSENRFDLDAESLSTIIDSMESEYDKSVLRAVLAATSTRSELYDLGLKPEAAIKNLETVLAVAKEVENAVVAGKDMTLLGLKAKIAKRENEIEELKASIKALRDIRADSRHIQTMEEKLTVCIEGLKSVQAVVECDNKYSKQKFNAAARRRAEHLINENRLRNRKSGAGAKRKLDDIDEELIAKAIEQKTTLHGRRHDMVLYYHKRVKRDDLLNIANYHLLQQGKKMIKSATTVYNRAKPKRVRSLQAKKHIGVVSTLLIKMNFIL